jgi:hypothetical protein
MTTTTDAAIAAIKEAANAPNDSIKAQVSQAAVSAQIEDKGANTLNDQIKDALSGAHNHAIDEIDDMIANLTSIKESIKLQRDLAVQRVQDFIGAVDKGLKGVKDLEAIMSRVVKEHVDTGPKTLATATNGPIIPANGAAH